MLRWLRSRQRGSISGRAPPCAHCPPCRKEVWLRPAPRVRMLTLAVYVCSPRWSGEAVDEMEGRLRDAGFRAAFPAIRVKFRPTAKVRRQCVCACARVCVRVCERDRTRCC